MDSEDFITSKKMIENIKAEERLKVCKEILNDCHNHFAVVPETLIEIILKIAQND